MTLSCSVNWRLVNGRVKSRVFKPVLASRESCVSHCSSPNAKVHRLLHCKNSAQTAPWKYIIANQRTVFCRLLQFLRLPEARAGYFLKQEQQSHRQCQCEHSWFKSRQGQSNSKMHQLQGCQWPRDREDLQIINTHPMMSSDIGALYFKRFMKDVCRLDCVQNRMYSSCIGGRVNFRKP